MPLTLSSLSMKCAPPFVSREKDGEDRQALPYYLLIGSPSPQYFKRRCAESVSACSPGDFSRFPSVVPPRRFVPRAPSSSGISVEIATDDGNRPRSGALVSSFLLLRPPVVLDMMWSTRVPAVLTDFPVVNTFFFFFPGPALQLPRKRKCSQEFYPRSALELLRRLETLAL